MEVFRGQLQGVPWIKERKLDRLLSENKRNGQRTGVYLTMKGISEKKIEKQRLKEMVLYIIFGIATTVVNIAVYRLLLVFVDYRISNLIAILSAKMFAYITNKLFVFRSKCENTKELFLEIIRFILSRGATGLLDFFGLIVAVELLNLDRVYSKYVLQIIVIILNYILGQKYIFRGSDTHDTD